MSKSLYDEAIAEAKTLRQVAEQNAKNAIIEAVTPRIRSFIEEQLIGEGSRDGSDGTPSDSDPVLKGAMQDEDSDEVTHPLPIMDEESVALDESALKSLVELIGGEELANALSSSSTEGALNDALSESFSSLSDEDRQKLLQIASKFNEGADFFDPDVINIEDNLHTENTGMSKPDEILYEIDLDELTETMGLDEAQHDAMEEAGLGGEEVAGESVEESSDALEEEDEGYHVSEETLEEIMSLYEAKLEIDLGDLELPEDLMPTVSVVEEEEEEEGEVEAEEEAEEPEEPEAVEELPEELPGLEEVYEIDPKMLAAELKRLRSQLSEGDASAMASHFGGGDAGNDPLDQELNVLSELRTELQKKSRHNRALTEKLNEYRSAVETLREQLTDLNLFNAKLLYVNKLLQNPKVSTDQRRSIIESLDNARSLREVKLLYKSLTESLSTVKSENLSESTVRRTLGSSSRATKRASAQTSEASEVSRWAQLAGLK